jgi:hypothetical protein
VQTIYLSTPTIIFFRKGTTRKGKTSIGCLIVLNMVNTLLLQFLQQLYNTTTGQYIAGKQPATHILNKTDWVIVICTHEPCYWSEPVPLGHRQLTTRNTKNLPLPLLPLALRQSSISTLSLSHAPEAGNFICHTPQAYRETGGSSPIESKCSRLVKSYRCC